MNERAEQAFDRIYSGAVNLGGEAGAQYCIAVAILQLTQEVHEVASSVRDLARTVDAINT